MTMDWTEKQIENLRKAYPELRWLDSSHLPEHLRNVVRPFEELAYAQAATSGAPYAGEQVSNSIHHLMLAKDAAVRAAVARHDFQNRGN